ncbi:MAG: glycosyltransferase [Candidatus Bathyarchaeia archaeon]
MKPNCLNKANKPDIALFIPSLRGGGAERVMLRLAEGFAERGLAVDLVLAQHEGEYINQVPSMVRVINLHSHRVIQSLPSLTKYLRQLRPKAMISAMNHANIVAILAAKIANVDTCLIVTEHLHLTSSMKYKLHLRESLIPMLIKLCYPLADHVVAISEEMKRDLQGYTSAPIRVIYNPVITQAIFSEALKSPTLDHFITDGTPLILGAGRLTQQKDFETLIHAFNIVRNKRLARLIIIGEGEERSTLQSLVTKLGVKDVFLPGFVQNPYALMARATVFVLSSKWEGLPTVLIEAMALGTPIVSTDCPTGPREILRNGDFGILVPIGDAQRMAEAILSVLDAPGKYKTLPERDTWVQNFALENVVQKYLDIINLDKHK